jgi:hypothetical protein
MSDLIADVVGEWLCLKGYFIIRGLKVGLNEIDVLAIKPRDGRIAEAAHYEISISTTPIGYLGKRNARRQSETEVRKSVARFVAKKYTNANTVKLIERLVGKRYDRYFVTGNRKHEMEVVALKEHGVKVIPVTQVLAELRDLRRRRKARKGNVPEFLETSSAQRYYQLLEMARAEAITYGTLCAPVPARQEAEGAAPGR